MNNLSTAIAEKLRKIRVLNNLTQLQISQKINVTLSMYQRMEKGSCNSVFHYLKDLAAIYKIQEDSLIHKDELDLVIEASNHINQQPSSENNNTYLSKDKYELLQNIIIEKNRRIDLLEWIIKEKGIAI
jgi:transcriptional regulator with XRE-family HTH domain